MTRSVSVTEARTHLSRLLTEVEAGVEVIITRRGRPVARLTASPAPRATGKVGARAVKGPAG